MSKKEESTTRQVKVIKVTLNTGRIIISSNYISKIRYYSTYITVSLFN
jgi:hypothetical protein